MAIFLFKKKKNLEDEFFLNYKTKEKKKKKKIKFLK